MNIDKIIEYIEQNPSWYKNIEQTKDLIRIELLSSIKTMTQFLPEDSPIYLRGWHVTHNILDIPKCQTCKNPSNWNPIQKEYRLFCSVKCASNSEFVRNKTKSTNIKKYGGISPAHSKNVRHKMEHTMLDRYGVCNAAQSSEIKDKMKSTNIERYGVENPSQSSEIKEKKKQTSQKNYGVDHYFKTEQYKEYVNSQEFKDIFNTTEFKEKKIEIMQERYGVNHPLHFEKFKKKSRETNIEKYGVYTKMLIRFSRDTLSKLRDKNWLRKKHHDEKLPLYVICKILENYDPSSLAKRFRLYNIEIKYFYKSYPEKVISEMLDSYGLVNNTDRKQIYPYELDLYVPAKKIAIEYCGLYWHSEEAGKDKNYHKMKYELCKSKGIKLITIFEDEWLEHSDLVQRKLIHILGLSQDKKIFARKVNVRVVDSQQKKQFFDDNHIQGDGPSSINYGAYYNDELVAVLGFIQHKNEFTLNRYATSCNVIGGFSKLLSHFEREYNSPKIVTFADLRWSDGDLYEKTGFLLDKIIPIDYNYVKGNKRYHKFNFRHKGLSVKLNEYDSNLTEKNNMLNNGYRRIWDCGKKRYIKN